jgi:Flp pilus assembly protein TadD
MAKEALMARLAESKREIGGQVAASLVLLLALVGCQTTQPVDTTAAALGPSPLLHLATDARHPVSEQAERHGDNPGEPLAAIRDAEALREGGRRGEAAALLERAALDSPRHPALLAAYGRALADVGDYQHAFDVLGRAHAPDRPDWRILSVQGAVLDEMGRHEEAQRYYGTALHIAPNEPSVLSNLGLSYALAKDLVRAETALRRAAAQPRSDPLVRQNLALIMTLQGRSSEARGSLPATVRPDEPAAIALRQLLAHQNGWTVAGQADAPQLRAEGG